MISCPVSINEFLFKNFTKGPWQKLNYECLISAYQEAREINDELEELLKATLTN